MTNELEDKEPRVPGEVPAASWVLVAGYWMLDISLPWSLPEAGREGGQGVRFALCLPHVQYLQVQILHRRDQLLSRHVSDFDS